MSVPAWADTPALRDHWKHPETVPIDGRKARKFKHRCLEHGLLSPHFTIREAASKDGTQLNAEQRKRAQRQAFRLERYRHQTGDHAVSLLSWLRSPFDNQRVGGATDSRHLYGDGTDGSFNPSLVLRIWKTGGIGWAGPGVGNGLVLHTDSRPGSGLTQWAYS